MDHRRRARRGLRRVRPDEGDPAEGESRRTIRFIGIAEILGAIGLILPGATGIAAVLTPIAAVCLAVTMVLAAVVHGRRGETQAIVVNVVLLALALFVAVMRFGPNAF